jgi:hypothetical protein
MVAPNATVVVHLANPKSYAVEFHIATAIAPDQLAGLQLSANGSAVPIVLTPDGSGGATGRAVIPADSVAAPRGSTELRFSVPYLKAPAGSAQPLGLAFDWLKIAPTSGGEPTA